MRKLVIGDIHGFYDGLMQALERAKYNPESDQLIQIGDIVDGFPNSVELFDFFISTKNKILIKGNHDHYAERYFNHPTYYTKNVWLQYGGSSTLQELKKKRVLPETGKFIAYRELLSTQVNYWIDEQNQLFVHGGIADHQNVEQVKDESIFYNDRTMWKSAYNNTQANQFVNDYKQVFIGHTSLFNLINRMPPSPDATPLLRRNIWNIDTGAGWGGRLTIIDADTHEYWQSDFAPYSARR